MRLPYRLDPGYWRLVLVEWSYIVRPFDMLADRRRWLWQRPEQCQFAARRSALRKLGDG